MQRSLDGEERAGSFAVLVSVMARVAGALGLPCVLFSIGGQSFVAPFFTAPRGECCVSSLDVAVGASWWGTNASMRRCCSRRLGQASKCLCSPSFPGPCFFVGWLVFFVSVFAGWPSWGASRPDGKKDSLKFRGGRGGQQAHALEGIFASCRYFRCENASLDVVGINICSGSYSLDLFFSGFWRGATPDVMRYCPVSCLGPLVKQLPVSGN